MGALPTEATIAHVLVSKYADHLPLYRQSQILAWAGLDLHRAVLADWVGKAAFHLKPVVDRLAEHLKRSDKLFMDEGKPPVPDLAGAEFAPVVIEPIDPEPRAAVASPVEIACGNIVVRLDAATPSAWVAEIVRALGAP